MDLWLITDDAEKSSVSHAVLTCSWQEPTQRKNWRP